jgi:hypothetical protein
VNSGLAKALGWTPRDAIGFAAMCNQPKDHRILGALCARFARRFDGIVDLGGRVLEGVETGAAGEPIRVVNPRNTRGILFVVSHVSEDGRRWDSQLCDAEFMESWLTDDSFRMVK